MVDPNALLRAWLLSSTSLATLLGTANQNGGIYAVVLPSSPIYDVARGPAVVVSTQGGTPLIEIAEVIDARIQVRTWAATLQHAKARQVYGVVRDLINGVSQVDLGADGYVIRCIETVPGQDMVDPDTGWATVVAFYQLMARAN